jgi:hypothetical protein
MKDETEHLNEVNQKLKEAFEEEFLFVYNFALRSFFQGNISQMQDKDRCARITLANLKDCLDDVFDEFLKDNAF